MSRDKWQFCNRFPRHLGAATANATFGRLLLFCDETSDFEVVGSTRGNVGRGNDLEAVTPFTR